MSLDTNGASGPDDVADGATSHQEHPLAPITGRIAPVDANPGRDWVLLRRLRAVAGRQQVRPHPARLR